MPATYSLPDATLLRAQAAWLAPARGRLLRQIGIAHRQRILDVGAGYGAVTEELVRRGGGPVVALDRQTAALRQVAAGHRVGGDVLRLPFAGSAFDLVFSQCVLLWVADVATAVAEIYRVLVPGGVFIALEPDYGGMIEHPPQIATRALWLAVLGRMGADVYIGRKLPGLLARQGFQIRVRLLEEVMAGSAQRFDFLATLPLTAEETATLTYIQHESAALRGAWAQVVHLPFMLVTAVKE